MKLTTSPILAEVDSRVVSNFGRRRDSTVLTTIFIALRDGYKILALLVYTPKTGTIQR